MTKLERIAAILGCLGVLMGALGAHGRVAEIVAEMDHSSEWRTAVLYHLVHAVAAWVAVSRGLRVPAILMMVGILLFSGSLYVLSLTGISKLGAITPLGGLAMMIGWAIAAWKAGSTQ